MDLYIDGQKFQFENELTLEEIKNKIFSKKETKIVAAIINNQIVDLNEKPMNKDKIKFLSVESVLGNRIYRRSLFLVMARAVYEIYPESTLLIEHSLSNGIYCELKKQTPLNLNDILTIQKRMKKIIKKDLPIKKITAEKEKIIEIFKKQGFDDKIQLIKQMNSKEYSLYELDGYYDYFYYNMVPATGYLKKFKLHYSFPGFFLLFPQKKNPNKVPKFKEQPKLGKVYMDYTKFGKVLGVSKACELNREVEKGRAPELIKIAEALHEKNIALIADKIYENINDKRVILIAGPSSSGKTTFSHRLSIQLKINGLNPARISIDNYFVDRDKTPRDKDGNLNFEDIEAIDLELLNNHLIKLLQGETVEIPEYNFKEGKKEFKKNYLHLKNNQPIILEGIHGLNNRLTRVIPDEHKYKIYISALTQINIDRHNRIPTTDTRKIRRIIRDHQFRGHSVEETIRIWPSVRRGEDKNIFPFQENADIMFNSALIYELGVLRKYAIPLLEEIDDNNDIYYEAKRLIEILKCFKPIEIDQIPSTSILKEFIGDSGFSEVH